MRPTYESADDRMNEERVATALSPMWNMSFSKMHRRSSFDYALLRDGDIYALAEIKCRTTPHNAYPTYMISTHKLKNCASSSEFINVPFLLIVAFSDQIMWWAGDGFCTHGIGGRRDRNDDRDVEIVTHIPIEHFEPVVSNGPLQ